MEVVNAWLAAAEDLGVKVTAPFKLIIESGGQKHSKSSSTILEDQKERSRVGSLVINPIPQNRDRSLDTMLRISPTPIDAMTEHFS